ncbi:hypothetical protein [Pararhodonellum marinum]|uniref:hypothetical protein n=1 Tax=Pararhodonellum marinum TaxID=2755358 RepID=UPI00188FA15B|nr:hypothetical protein [Pararhodonellum marinum]
MKSLNKSIRLILNDKKMYVRNDARKKVIQYNSRQQTEMSGTSLSDDRRACPTTAGDFRLRTSDPFEEEYWVTGKEADIQKKI